VVVGLICGGGGANLRVLLDVQYSRNPAGPCPPRLRAVNIASDTTRAAEPAGDVKFLERSASPVGDWNEADKIWLGEDAISAAFRDGGRSAEPSRMYAPKRPDLRTRHGFRRCRSEWDRCHLPSERMSGEVS